MPNSRSFSLLFWKNFFNVNFSHTSWAITDHNLHIRLYRNCNCVLCYEKKNESSHKWSVLMSCVYLHWFNLPLLFQTINQVTQQKKQKPEVCFKSDHLIQYTATQEHRSSQVAVTTALIRCLLSTNKQWWNQQLCSLTLGGGPDNRTGLQAIGSEWGQSSPRLQVWLKAGRDSARENPGSEVVATTLPLPVINSCFRGDAKIPHASKPQSCPVFFWWSARWSGRGKVELGGGRIWSQDNPGAAAGGLVSEEEHFDGIWTRVGPHQRAWHAKWQTCIRIHATMLSGFKDKWRQG